MNWKVQNIFASSFLHLTEMQFHYVISYAVQVHWISAHIWPVKWWRAKLRHMLRIELIIPPNQWWKWKPHIFMFLPFSQSFHYIGAFLLVFIRSHLVSTSYIFSTASSGLRDQPRTKCFPSYNHSLQTSNMASTLLFMAARHFCSLS